MTNTDSVLPIVGSDIFELCMFGPNKKPEYVGYFNDVTAADHFIAKNQENDIYLTPQKLNPRLAEGSENKMKRAYTRTDDSGVIGYKYLLIDLDPLQILSDKTIVHRPKGTSASEVEHRAAVDCAWHIVKEIGLRDENYLLIDSGNGAHIYIPVEWGIQKSAIEAALKGIKTLYDTKLVEVDPTVVNPSRVMRAPGSMNCKGGIKRPCRYLHCPEHLAQVDFDFIAGLKVKVIIEPVKSGFKEFKEDLAEEIADKLGYREKKGSTIYLLDECPFCKSTDRAAVIGRVGVDGGYFFKCHHNRCAGKNWADLKEHVGVSNGRFDRVKRILKDQGTNALELPEVQAEISKIKASENLHKLADETGIEYKILRAATRKPLAIAQDMADGWIKEYHIKTDRLSRVIYYYQDGVYIEGTDFIAGLIDKNFRGINTTGFIMNVLEYVRRQSLYDFKDEWLAVENGLINPQNFEIVEFNPEIVTRIKLDVRYDPAATCPRWNAFIEECESDPVLLQEAAGYPFLPGYPYQKAVMLLGGGGQGKSVYLRVIGSIYGHDNVSAASLQSLIDNRFATSDLYGRIANIAGDIPDMALANTGIFKSLTGDDRVRAERKGKDAFEFENRAKLLFSANQLPPSKDRSSGFTRRWILIDFNRVMVQKPNPRLAADLMTEKSGIFNWMLAGAKRVHDNGFTYTTNPEKMAKQYLQRSEPVIEFLEQCCDENLDGFEPSSKITATYSFWARVNRKKRMGVRELITAMKTQTVYPIEHDRHYEYGTDMKGDPCIIGRAMGFSGIKLKEGITDQLKAKEKEIKAAEEKAAKKRKAKSKTRKGNPETQSNFPDPGFNPPVATAM